MNRREVARAWSATPSSGERAPSAGVGRFNFVVIACTYCHDLAYRERQTWSMEGRKNARFIFCTILFIRSLGGSLYSSRRSCFRFRRGGGATSQSAPELREKRRCTSLPGRHTVARASHTETTKTSERSRDSRVEKRPTLVLVSVFPRRVTMCRLPKPVGVVGLALPVGVVNQTPDDQPTRGDDALGHTASA